MKENGLNSTCTLIGKYSSALEAPAVVSQVYQQDIEELPPPGVSNSLPSASILHSG